MSLLRLTLCLVAAIGAYLFFDRTDDVRTLQADGGFAYAGYEIQPQEAFALTGRVLSRKNYRSGREAELSPTDLALGWGAMQAPENVAALKFSQRNRFMFWKAKRLPVPRQELESHMANVHIIPANEVVAATLQSIDANDVVLLQGALVNVVGADGWRWRTSLSRTDTGRGSCELLWLEQISVLN